MTNKIIRWSIEKFVYQVRIIFNAHGYQNFIYLHIYLIYVSGSGQTFYDVIYRLIQLLTYKDYSNKILSCSQVMVKLINTIQKNIFKFANINFVSHHKYTTVVNGTFVKAVYFFLYFVCYSGCLQWYSKVKL